MRDFSEDSTDQENRKLRDMAYREWQKSEREPLWPILVLLAFGLGGILFVVMWVS